MIFYHLNFKFLYVEDVTWGLCGDWRCRCNLFWSCWVFEIQILPVIMFLFWDECSEDARSSIPFLRPLLSPRLEFCFSWKTAIEIAGVMLTRLSEINYFKAGTLAIDFFYLGRFLSLTQSNGFSTTKLRLLLKFQLFTCNAPSYTVNCIS